MRPARPAAGFPRVFRAAGTLLLALLPGFAPAQVQDFTFLHASDTHAPAAGSAEVLAAAALSGEVDLEPYGVKVPPPDLLVVTGDLTEFGGAGAGRRSFDAYLRWLEATKLPVQHVLGNHDGTWDCLRPALRALGQAPSRLVRHRGACLLFIDSASPQDPRPSFGADAVAFLRVALKDVSRDVPVFLFSHHPPDGQEFASARDRGLVEDLLDGYQVAAWFVGHYHTAFRARTDGLDVVGGGSTLPKTPAQRGFNVVSVKDGMLRVAFRTFGSTPSWTPLLEKRLGEPYHVGLLVNEPEPGAKMDGDKVAVQATFRGPAEDLTADARIEGTDLSAQLSVAKAGSTVNVSGSLPVASLGNGEHVLRVTVHGPGKAAWTRTVPVTSHRSRGLAVEWSTTVDGSVRTLARFGATLLVAGSDGVVRGLDLKTGSARFRTAVGAEVLARPLVLKDRALVPAGDGQARAIDARGKVLWTADVGAAAYSAPVLAGTTAVFATNAGTLAGLDPETGQRRWLIPAADYAIESPLVFDGDRLLLGAWDEHVRAFALEAQGPRQLWKSPSQGVRAAKSAKRYYSPADAPPVSSAGLVYVADRAYVLSVLDAKTGELLGHHDGVVAVAPGPRPGTVVARGKDDKVLLLEGHQPAWELAAPTGLVPSPPVALPGGRYLVVGDHGELTVFTPGKEKADFEHSLATGSYLLATPEVAGDVVVFGALDGTVTALRIPRPPPGGPR